MDRRRRDYPEVPWPFESDPERHLITVRPAPGYTVGYYADADVVELSRGYAIPGEFFVLVARRDAPAIALRLVVERGELVCDQAALVRTPGSRGLAATDMRIRLGELVAAAGVAAGGAYDSETRTISHAAGTREHASAPKRRRGKRISHQHLMKVAAIYRAALVTGQPPTQAVATQMRTARSNAGRWVMEARRRGFLGPAKPGRPGEKKGGGSGSPRRLASERHGPGGPAGLQNR